MPISLDELRELSRNELVEVIAELWEVHPGWRTVIVEPGDEVELEIKGDSLDIVVPQIEDPLHSDVEVSVEILAIQEEPYVELEFIHVRHGGEDKVVKDVHFDSLEQVASGYKVRKSVIVTTGAGPEETIDERLYSGHRFVEGAELCNLIEKYTEYGFDYNAYF